MIRHFVVAALTLFLSLLAIVSFSSASAPGKLIVGGKNFTEGFIISEIFAQIIEKKTNIQVERRFGLGGTYIAFEALRKGEIDLYPEYTGTALMTLMKSEVLKDPDAAYRKLNAYFPSRGLTFLKPLGFENTYTLTMTRKKAESMHIGCISDLAPHAPSLVVACTHEFIERPDGLNVLTKYYGLNFKAVKGMDPGLTYMAAKSGKADVIDGFSTDGRIPAFNLVILRDDRHFFPPYQAAPFVRIDALERFPGLAPALDQLAGKISGEDIQRLNYSVDQMGIETSLAAHNFLASKGLIDESARPLNTANTFLSMVIQRKGDILRLTIEHLYLTVTAVGLAILLAVPIGILMSRFGKLSGPIIYTVNIIQTIPSLALLGFMIPLFGIGAFPAIVALFLYALLPIVSNTYTGITQVNPDLVEAARGMGLKDFQILLLVELPLALTVIMSGIRTSTVINIGTATLAAFVGAGGLGALILRGVSLSNNNLILCGAVPAALLAVLADKFLKICEGALRPKGMRVKREKKNPAQS